MATFEIPGEISRIECIATGRGVNIRRYLDRAYGTGRWRKMKGVAKVSFPGGITYTAEIHWFEANGIGRRDFKIKRLLDE